MITFLMIVLLVAVIVGLSVAVYYAPYWLAKASIFLTEVQDGWCKIHMCRGQYVRTLGPGWHWIGFPGINTLYDRKMMFLKSVTDKDGRAQAEAHPTEKEKEKNGGVISSFKTTQYPYAVPFVNVEDSNGLHLHGLVSVYGTMRDYEKAFFHNSDWYATVISTVSSSFTDLIAEVAYDKDIAGGKDKEKKKMARITVGVRLWEMLNSPQPDGKPSVLSELLDTVGFEIEKVELRSIDPPPGWRDITLGPYKAEREEAASGAIARAESTKAAGPIEIAMEGWIEKRRREGETLAQTEDRLRAGGEYERHKDLLADQINRFRKTVQERKIDMSSGGKPFGTNSVGEIAATIAAAVVAANSKDSSEGGGKRDKGGNRDNRGGGDRKPLSEMKEEERQELADTYRRKRR